jgi:hypothetical protein
VCGAAIHCKQYLYWLENRDMHDGLLNCFHLLSVPHVLLVRWEKRVPEFQFRQYLFAAQASVHTSHRMNAGSVLHFAVGYTHKECICRS